MAPAVADVSIASVGVDDLLALRRVLTAVGPLRGNLLDGGAADAAVSSASSGVARFDNLVRLIATGAIDTPERCLFTNLGMNHR